MSFRGRSPTNLKAGIVEISTNPSLRSLAALGMTIQTALHTATAPIAPTAPTAATAS